MEQPESPPPLSTYAGGPTGVGGWLLFLCIALTILMPLATLSSITAGMRDSLSLVGKIPRWGLFFFIDTSVSTALAVLSFLAGYRMWRSYPEADRWGHVALISQFFYQLFAVALVYLMRFEPEIETALVREMWPGAGRGLAGSLIWLLYLARSKRVKNTYRPIVGVGSVLKA